MRTHVRFRTTIFKQPQESDEYFPGIELADWLVQKFGNTFNLDYMDESRYCLLFLGDPIEKKLSGASGHVENDTWLVFMHMKASLIDKVFKRSTPDELHKNFIAALDKELQYNPEITEIEWFQENSGHQEYNYGKSAFGPENS